MSQNSIAVRIRTHAPRPSRRGAWAGYLLVSPAFFLFILFTFIPIGWALLLSLQNFNIFANHGSFVGLANYSAAVHNPAFWNSLWDTAYYTLGSVPLTIALGLLVAVALSHRKVRWQGVFQTVFFLPYIVSSVGASLVWKWLFDTNFGLFNTVLGWFGIGAVPWLTAPGPAMPAIILMSIWGGIGFDVVLFQAGLKAVPRELREAAEVDGATSGQTFWRVTFPLLAPTTLFVLIISMINAVQVFTNVQVMTDGGPLNATNVIVFYIYQEAFQFFNLGYGSALAMILLAITLGLTALQLRASRRFVYYEGERDGGG